MTPADYVGLGAGSCAALIVVALLTGVLTAAPLITGALFAAVLVTALVIASVDGTRDRR